MRSFVTRLVAVGLFASSAQGALVAGDSYAIGSDPSAGQYQAGVALKNQPSTLATTGFVNGGYASGTGTSNFAATTNGLNNATVGATSDGSGKVNWISAPLDAINRSVARNLSPAVPASSTYYLSHLVNRGDIPEAGGTGYVMTGFGNTTSPTVDAAGNTAGTLAGLYVGFAQNGVADNFGNLVIRSRNAASNTAADTVLIDGATASTFGNTYHVVVKIDVNASGGTDVVTWWLDPTNGTSDATLSETAAATGTFNSFALQSGSDFVRLNYAARNWNGSAFFDEPRLSTDLAGLGLAVPEPAGLAGLVLGTLLLARRGRRPA